MRLDTFPILLASCRPSHSAQLFCIRMRESVLNAKEVGTFLWKEWNFYYAFPNRFHLATQTVEHQTACTTLVEFTIPLVV